MDKERERNFWSIWRERKKTNLRLERKGFKQSRGVMYLLGYDKLTSIN